MTIRIAIMGYGSAGRQHVQALSGMDGVEIAGVLETNPDIDLGNLPKFESWGELLDDKNVNAVSLCIAPGGRYQLAQDALSHGKSVLLEKPPCTSVREIDSLLQSANMAKKTVGVMFQHRYRIPDEILNMSWDNRTTAILEVSRPRDSERYFYAWRRNPQLSFGGITAHLGVHYLDLACFLLGEPVSFKEAGRREILPGIDLRVSGVVEFRSGAVMVFTVTGEAEARSERLVINGVDTRLVIDNGAATVERNGEIIHYEAQPTQQMRKRLYQDFFTSVEEHRHPERCYLEGARGVTLLLEQIATRVVVTS